VPVLADRYRVLRVDARGQGATPRPPGYAFSPDGFVRDAVDLLDQLGIDRVHWVGASGGGIVGQHAALTVPDRIDSLSLIATTPRFRSPVADFDSWLAPLDRGDVAGFLLRDAERRFGADRPERTRWIVDELARTPADVTAELHRWVRGVDLTERLAEIGCPTLVVTGEHDSLTDLHDADLFVQRIPDVRLCVLRGRPHNIAYTEPRLVASIVRQFVDEVTRRAAEASGEVTTRLPVSAEQVRSVAQLAAIDLPPDRLATLTSTLSEFLARSESLHAIEPGDHEPPVITYDRQARA
jgi:pimeloyl-ACP methyl ester carboxylesterase